MARLLPASLVVIAFTTIIILVCVKQSTSASAGLTNSVRETTEDASARHRVPALNYLLFSAAIKGNQNKTLTNLLQDSNHSHVSNAINLELANLAWSKMRLNALDYAQQRISEARPAINQLLEQANISSSCHRSLNDILNSLARLDDWAVKSK